MGLGLHKLVRRTTWRMPLWEAVQILLALAIPFLLFPHIVNTRIASSVFGVRDTYLYELVRLWPERAVPQSLLLLIVWTHGCVGLHYWLRLTDTYWRYAWVLLVVAASGAGTCHRRLCGVGHTHGRHHVRSGDAGQAEGEFALAQRRRQRDHGLAARMVRNTDLPACSR